MFFKKKTVFPLAKHPIEKAFTSMGVDSYQFTDIFNIPCMRGFSAVQFYNELQMRCDKDYLIKDCEAHEELNKQIEEWLSGKAGHVSVTGAFKALQESNRLILQKRERLDWILEPETMYKLAAVVYFDADEDPYNYDSRYAAKKIERWKKDSEALTFFLSQPMSRYQPYFDQLQVDSAAYIRMIGDLTAQQMENISTILSSKAQRKPTHN